MRGEFAIPHADPGVQYCRSSYPRLIFIFGCQCPMSPATFGCLYTPSGMINQNNRLYYPSWLAGREHHDARYKHASIKHAHTTHHPCMYLPCNNERTKKKNITITAFANISPIPLDYMVPNPSLWLIATIKRSFSFSIVGYSGSSR